MERANHLATGSPSRLQYLFFLFVRDFQGELSNPLTEYHKKICTVFFFFAILIFLPILITSISFSDYAEKIRIHVKKITAIALGEEVKGKPDSLLL